MKTCQVINMKCWRFLPDSKFIRLTSLLFGSLSLFPLISTVPGTPKNEAALFFKRAASPYRSVLSNLSYQTQASALCWICSPQQNDESYCNIHPGSSHLSFLQRQLRHPRPAVIEFIQLCVLSRAEAVTVAPGHRLVCRGRRQSAV